VTELRHAVASRAADAGLAGERLDDFVAAVNELLTNAVRHGGGTGHVQLWREPTAVVCEVTDRGAGMPAGWTSRTGRPAPDEPGGRGLWLVGELTDAVELKTGDAGTAVRISTNVF
jgi:serine/threonine-protein kinase RsbW